MKFRILFVFFYFVFFASCKKEIPASINLKVEYEDKLNKDLPKLFSLFVYKNGKIFKKYSRFEKPYIEKVIIIDSLQNGKYKFVYMNFLNQTLSKNVEVKENKNYEISINPDYSDYKKYINKSLIGNLKDNQNVELFIESRGCMSSFEGNLKISKIGKEFIAENHEIKKTLNRKELDLIIKMECELNLLQNGGCTTSDHYIIKFGKLKKEFYDTTCAWRGWANVNEKLNWNIKNGS